MSGSTDESNVNSNLRYRILSSPLIPVMAVLFIVSTVFSAVSLISLINPERAEYFREAIEAKGLFESGTVTVHFVLHIIARAALFIMSAVLASGVSYMFANKKHKKNPGRETGVSAMIWTFEAVHKLVIPAGALLGILFIYRLIMFIIRCFVKRYENATIMSFFSTLFGELVLAAVVVGILFWIFRFSSTLVDDLTSLRYSLTVQKSSVYGASHLTFFSIIASAALTLLLSFAMSYDWLALTAFLASAAAQLLSALFMRGLKKIAEEQAYREYAASAKSSDAKD